MADIAINPVVRRVQFTGNTGLGPFAFTFNILQNTDIIVYKNTTLLTLTTDYTVTINANGTGSVTLTGSGSGTSLITTDNLTIIGGRELSRTTDFVTAGDLLASSLNEQLDSNVIMSQQLDERFSRTISVSPGDADKTLTLPTVADRKDKILKFDTEGNVEAAAASTVFANTVVGANFTNNVFTGDGSTVAFTTTVAAGSKNNCQIYIDGVYQEKASFSINATTLTFTEAPPLNASIEVIIGNAIETLDADSGNINYNQGGTGAQTRTVENKLQEAVSVKDFGATGDGVTDDTAAIQTAVSASANKSLLFPSGTYIISERILLVSGISIYGNKDAVVKQKDNNPTRANLFGMFVAEGSAKSDISIDGLIFDGNWANNVDHGTPDGSGNQDPFHAGSLLAAINITNVERLVIKNCTVKNCWGSGIWISDCSESIIEGNFVFNFRITGISFRNNTSISSVVPTKSSISNNVIKTGTVGIHGIFGVSAVSMDGNILSDLSDQQRFPSFGYSGTYPNVYPTTGGFNTSSDGGYVSPALLGDGAGIELTGKYTDVAAVSNSSINLSNNSANNCQIGMRVEELSLSVSLNGNVCADCLANGIFIFSSRRVSVTGNVCTGNAEAGIRIERLTTEDTPQLFAISGNTCFGNGTYGLSIVAGQYGSITGNVFSGNNTTSIANGGSIELADVDSIYCEYLVINSNQMSDYSGNDNYGIYSSSTSHSSNIVANNSFLGFNTSATNISLASNKVCSNLGFATSTFGTASVAIGNTSVDVTHNMPFSPFNGEIQATPVTDLGSRYFWVDTIGASTFRINVDSAASGVPIFFNWMIAEER